MDVNPETLSYYIERADISLDELRTSVKGIDLFLTGEKQPTFNQISNIAKKLMHSSPAVSKAVPGLSPGLSLLTCLATYTPFTPSKSG